MSITGCTEQELTLEVGKLYIIDGKHSWTMGFQEMFVEKITETSYKLRKQSSDGSWYVEWVRKSNFEEDKYIIECIGTLSYPPALPSEVVQINTTPRIICPYCTGSGTLPDEMSTAGTKTCPYCWGLGYRM